MPPAERPHILRTEADLAALFGAPSEASLRKESPVITAEYGAMIRASPFLVLATSGPTGLDASPRGDPPGFVVVEDERTLLLPERRGNNRVDSLRNLLTDPRVGLLFLIPGVGETLRVNGRAELSVDPALLERFRMQGQLPKCVLVIRVEAVYFQCARAILRANLWAAPVPEQVARVPSPGQILEALSAREIDGAAYDRALPARQRETLY
jgi:PPOX class probable FMN-dependent enzyme